MRVTPLILALPALAVADQIPIFDQLKGQFNSLLAQVTGAATSVASSIPTPSVVNPVDAGAAAIANSAVEKITLENYQNVLRGDRATASPGIEEWMMYVTGGNKTCYGLCDHANNEWYKAIPMLLASKNTPHLASLDCETQPVLCHAWALGAPTLVHMFLPQPLPDQSTPASTLRSIGLNRTEVTAGYIASLHTEEKYKDFPVYEGFWHPFDGPLAKFGAGIPLGYVIWGFSQVPSWMIMIGISFFSRTIM